MEIVEKRLPSWSGSGRRRTPPLCISLLLLTGSIGGCDIPTEAPILEQRWILPAEEMVMEVDELLPADVSVIPGGSAFTVHTDPVTFQETLGGLCPACAPFHGQTTPKPAFESEFSENVSLPDDVEAAEISEGRVVVVAHNGLTFDPLQPQGGNPGSISIALRDGGVGGPILAEVLVEGATTSFDPGTTLSRTLEYSGPVTAELWVVTTIDSPAGGLDPGDWVLVRLTDEIQVTATPQTLEATSAVVSVAGETFELIDTDLDVEDLDDEIVDRIQSGAAIMEVSNPWAIGASLTLTVDGPTMATPVVKVVAVPASPSSTVRVEFSQAELKSFLGQSDITMSGDGTVAPEAGFVTVSPDQILLIDTELDLTIRIG